MNAELEKKISEIRKIAENAQNPLYFFDDDPDGSCAFLLFYRFIQKGKGIILKQKHINEDFLRKVEEYNPDVIFILDIPSVAKEFLDGAGRTIVWIDHHPIDDKAYLGDALYLNPLLFPPSESSPTSYLAYKIIKQDIWLAVIGVVADWMLPDFFDEFVKEYPELVPEKYNDFLDYRFKGPIGELVRIIVFNLKGNSREAMKSLKILTRIDSPMEILEHQTPRALFIYRKYEHFYKQFSELLDSIAVPAGKFIFFKYTVKKTSFTSELSNYLIYKNPEKVIVIGRVKDGITRCSVRSKKYDVRTPLLKILANFESSGASGGGHEHSCGFNMSLKDYHLFIKQFREEINKQP
ncbi:MAG: DHH family phosphoesterase [Candidatus Woesearchaeota archaeon]